MSTPHPTYEFNPPPSWPRPPAGWTPPPGWRPPAQWPPVPAGWVLWVPSRQPTRPRWLRRRWVWAGFVVVAILLGMLTGGSDALLLGGLALLLVALVALMQPRWVGARSRMVSAVLAAISVVSLVAGAATTAASGTPGPSAGMPPAATAAPSSTPSATPRTEPSAEPPSAMPPATSASPTPPRSPRPTAGTALAAVDDLDVKGRAPKTGYTRSAYGNGWRSTDGCSTRETILRRDLGAVTVAGDSDCAVVAGTLHDPYTGEMERLTAKTLPTADIDHVVALGDSWQKGGQQWSHARRVQFANDPLNLLVTTRSVNASKGDGDTATWLPPDKSFRCSYVARQVSVKKKYNLWVTPAEQLAMTRVLSSCPDQTLFSASDARKLRDEHATTARPKADAPTSPAPKRSTRKKIETTRPSATDPRFPTCAAANRAGYGPYQRGVDPEYDWYRDRDGDGLVCER